MGLLGRLFGVPAPPPERVEPTMARPRSGSRAYGGAVFDRLTADWVAQGTSQDSEVFSSLRALRNRSRQLVRDNDYAKNAKRAVMNNVVGRGVRLQAKMKLQRGDRLNEALNEQIETAWKRWCRAENCHTAGKLSFSDIERMLIGGICESGEIFVRLIRQPFGRSKIPLALEIIEADQCAEFRVGRAGENQVRMGVEMDGWRRPVAYHMWPYHPGDLTFTQPTNASLLRLPAEDVIHLFVPERPGETRGVPWFHTALKRLHHMEGYEESEVVAARASSAMMGFIETPEPAAVDDETNIDGQAVDEFAPGMIRQLGPGEKFNGFAPTRVNGGFDPFMRSMLRGVAAGIGASYETLSKDYSQSNYSSSRLALLDDRDQWRVLQQWFIQRFHRQVFEAWLTMAVLSGEIIAPGFLVDAEGMLDQVHWQPRSWGWVDPEKEVNAYIRAVRGGLMTLEDVIEQGTGGTRTDFEEVMEQRAREIAMFKEMELVFDTDPSQVAMNGMAQKAYPADMGEPLVAQPGAATGPDIAAPPQQEGKPPQK